MNAIGKECRLYDYTKYKSVDELVNSGKSIKCMPIGKHHAVKLYISNGKTLLCSPDQEIMLPNGEWLESKNLAGKKVAKVGCPCGNDIFIDKIEYVDDVDLYIFKTTTNHSWTFADVGLIIKEYEGDLL